MSKQKMSLERAGAIALSIVTTQIQRRGISLQPEEFEGKMETLRKSVGLTHEDLRWFAKTVAVPAAMVACKMIETMPELMEGEKVRSANIALKFLQAEGVNIKPSSFSEMLRSQSKRIDIIIDELADFYSTHIIPTCLMRCMGWDEISITGTGKAPFTMPEGEEQPPGSFRIEEVSTSPLPHN